MPAKETKIIRNYVDHTLGFPVKLGDVTFVRFRDDWAAKIDYNAMMLRVLNQLCHLPRPLTGAEVGFVRDYFQLTLTGFAAKFGISHVAVHKWEKRKQQPTGMQWSTEKDLRLFIQSQLSKDPRVIGLLYRELAEKPATAKDLSKAPMPIAA